MAGPIDELLGLLKKLTEKKQPEEIVVHPQEEMFPVETKEGKIVTQTPSPTQAEQISAAATEKAKQRIREGILPRRYNIDEESILAAGEKALPNPLELPPKSGLIRGGLHAAASTGFVPRNLLWNQNTQKMYEKYLESSRKAGVPVTELKDKDEAVKEVIANMNEIAQEKLSKMKGPDKDKFAQHLKGVFDFYQRYGAKEGGAPGAPGHLFAAQYPTKKEEEEAFGRFAEKTKEAAAPKIPEVSGVHPYLGEVGTSDLMALKGHDTWMASKLGVEEWSRLRPVVAMAGDILLDVLNVVDIAKGTATGLLKTAAPSVKAGALIERPTVVNALKFGTSEVKKIAEMSKLSGKTIKEVVHSTSPESKLARDFIEQNANELQRLAKEKEIPFNELTFDDVKNLMVKKAEDYATPFYKKGVTEGRPVALPDIEFTQAQKGPISTGELEVLQQKLATPQKPPVGERVVSALKDIGTYGPEKLVGDVIGGGTQAAKKLMETWAASENPLLRRLAATMKGASERFSYGAPARSVIEAANVQIPEAELAKTAGVKYEPDIFQEFGQRSAVKNVLTRTPEQQKEWAAKNYMKLQQFVQERGAIPAKNIEKAREIIKGIPYLENFDQLPEAVQLRIQNGLQGMHAQIKDGPFKGMRDPRRLTPKGLVFLDTVKKAAEAAYPGTGRQTADALVSLSRKTAEETIESVKAGNFPKKFIKTDQDYIALAPKDAKNLPVMSTRKSDYYGMNTDQINNLIERQKILQNPTKDVVRAVETASGGKFEDFRNVYNWMRDARVLAGGVEDIPTLKEIHDEFLKAIDFEKIPMKSKDDVASFVNTIVPKAPDIFKQDLTELLQNYVVKGNAPGTKNVFESMGRLDIRPDLMSDVIKPVVGPAEKNFYRTEHTISQFPETWADQQQRRMTDQFLDSFSKENPELIKRIPKASPANITETLAKENGFNTVEEYAAAVAKQHDDAMRQGMEKISSGFQRDPKKGYVQSGSKWDVSDKYEYYMRPEIKDLLNNYKRSTGGVLGAAQRIVAEQKTSMTVAKLEGLAFSLANMASTALQNGLEAPVQNLIKNYGESTALLSGKNLGKFFTFSDGTKMTGKQLLDTVRKKELFGGMFDEPQMAGAFEQLHKQGVKGIAADLGNEPGAIRFAKNLFAQILPSKSALGKTMGSIAKAGEEQGRLASVLMLKDAGYDITSAVEKTLGSLVAYNRQTPFEKNVLSKVFIPFYAFTKAMFLKTVKDPRVVRQMGEVYALERGQEHREKDIFDYGQGMTGPLDFTYKDPETGDEYQINLSRFLMPGGMFQEQPSRSFAGNVVGAMNPAVTASLETVMGKNVRTGKPLLGESQYQEPIFRLFGKEITGKEPAYLAYGLSKTVPGANIVKSLSDYMQGRVIKPEGKPTEPKQFASLVTGSVFKKDPYFMAQSMNQEFGKKIDSGIGKMDHLISSITSIEYDPKETVGLRTMGYEPKSVPEEKMHSTAKEISITFDENANNIRDAIYVQLVARERLQKEMSKIPSEKMQDYELRLKKLEVNVRNLVGKYTDMQRRIHYLNRVLPFEIGEESGAPAK